MALLFPKWLPGAHSPRGEIEKLAGLVIKANGQVLPWTRDPVDVFAFHIDVPAGAQALDVEFQFLSATKPDQGRIAVTPTMISLQPNSVSLYPAGYYTRQIPIQMTATFPTGWTAAGAVPAAAAPLLPRPANRRCRRADDAHLDQQGQRPLMAPCSCFLRQPIGRRQLLHRW